MAKTVIVTGASGNLGQAVIKKFLAEGHRVVGTVLHNDPVNLAEGGLARKTADLSDEEDAGRFVESVITEYGGIDVAVLTVGGFAMGKIGDTKAADILKQYQLNFETAYHIARPVFLQMLEQNGGRIFLVGSRPGLDAKSGKGMIAYSLAKSLIFRLADLMNEEGKAHQVVTNVIIPSTIDTPQNRKSMPDADFSSWVRAEEIADIIYFYSGDDARSLREPLLKVYGNS